MTRDIMLGVNIDHVATLRQARGTSYPDPVLAATTAEQSGADLITLHLREDRRHIQDRDLPLMKACIQTRMNLECAVTDEMIDIACQTQPHDVCLVPEKREEVTTEGGLDVRSQHTAVERAVRQLQQEGIRVSLFIDPATDQIEAAKASGATVVELHTGAYAEQQGLSQSDELERVVQAAEHAQSMGLVVNAGHGLHYHNVKPIAAIPEIVELNIGHAIVSRAVMTGMAAAVGDMKRLMSEARRQ